jgi:hypothetical protein
MKIFHSNHKQSLKSSLHVFIEHRYSSLNINVICVKHRHKLFKFTSGFAPPKSWWRGEYSPYYTNTRYVGFVLVPTSRPSYPSSVEGSSSLSRHDSKSLAEDVVDLDERRLVLLTWARGRWRREAFSICATESRSEWVRQRCHEMTSSLSSPVSFNELDSLN